MIRLDNRDITRLLQTAPDTRGYIFMETGANPISLAVIKAGAATHLGEGMNALDATVMQIIREQNLGVIPYRHQTEESITTENCVATFEQFEASKGTIGTYAFILGSRLVLKTVERRGGSCRLVPETYQHYYGSSDKRRAEIQEMLFKQPFLPGVSPKE